MNESRDLTGDSLSARVQARDEILESLDASMELVGTARLHARTDTNLDNTLYNVRSTLFKLRKELDGMEMGDKD